MSEEVEERTPLEQLIYDAHYNAVKDWLEEEGVLGQMCDAAREGAIEACEGAIPFWSRKVSKS